MTLLRKISDILLGMSRMTVVRHMVISIDLLLHSQSPYGRVIVSTANNKPRKLEDSG
jgi:hypothetical protein